DCDLAYYGFRQRVAELNVSQAKVTSIFNIYVRWSVVAILIIIKSRYSRVPVRGVLGCPRVVAIIDGNITQSVEALKPTLVVVKDLVAVRTVEEQTQIKRFIGKIEIERSEKIGNRTSKTYAIVVVNLAVAVCIDEFAIPRPGDITVVIFRLGSIQFLGNRIQFIDFLLRLENAV